MSRYEMDDGKNKRLKRRKHGSVGRTRDKSEGRVVDRQIDYNFGEIDSALDGNKDKGKGKKIKLSSSS